MKKLIESYPFQSCISIAAIVIALPLIWRQMPNVSFVLYPIVLVAVSWATGVFVTRLVPLKPDETTSYSQLILFLISCAGIGFFTIWAATIPLEIMGNLWRGNVLISNLIYGILSLSAGLWAAYSIRLLKKSNSMGTVAIVAGLAFLMVAVMLSSAVYKLPDFSLAEHINSSYTRIQYVLYGLLEALYWRVVFPMGFIAALTLNLFFEKN